RRDPHAFCCLLHGLAALEHGLCTRDLRWCELAWASELHSTTLGGCHRLARAPRYHGARVLRVVRGVDGPLPAFLRARVAALGKGTEGDAVLHPISKKDDSLDHRAERAIDGGDHERIAGLEPLPDGLEAGALSRRPADGFVSIYTVASR